MSPALVAELAGRCTGQVVAGASLARFTTLRVGGPARVLVTAETPDDLAVVGEVCRTHRVATAVVGRGSNLLVDDDGFDGVVVTLGRGFRGVVIDDGDVRAGAAEPLPTLAATVADAGLTGFAWACAVPGTLGGAVRMNAGAHGGEIADHLVEAEVHRLGTSATETWPAAVLGLGYRHSELPDDAVVTAARLRFSHGDREAERAAIGEIRAWRRANQPLNEPNCGSVFTNPVPRSAGELIESSGLKGFAIGGAEVSRRHANFIVTRPGATAADVAGLIAEVRRRVEADHGVVLTPEVTWLGDASRGGRPW